MYTDFANEFIHFITEFDFELGLRRKKTLSTLEFKKIYIIYEASIDHFRSQYSFLMYKM